MSRYFRLSDPLTPVEVTELAAFLASDKCQEDALDIHQLQGYLWAVAASPVVLQTDDWLPVVFGDVDEAGLAQSPFESEEEYEYIIGLLRRLHAQVGRALAQEQNPVAAYALADAEAPDLPLSRWCQGLLVGHGWLEEVWDDILAQEAEEGEDRELKEIVETTLGLVSTLADVPRALAEAPEPDVVREALAGAFAGLSGVLLAYGQAGRDLADAVEELEKIYAKTGRNDPCPCGSGEKFKKCCMP